MNILLTGGTGYIGSHTCISLLQERHTVIIIDNLSNSKADVLNKIKQITGREVTFYKADITDEAALENVFSANKINAVVHFAGLKSVRESNEKPLIYYHNNIVGILNLVKLCEKYRVNKFVFSSSATVYGENQVPFVESMRLLPTINPYGETKVIGERILTDIAKSYPRFSVSILRYFNPVGAHESGLIGESPNGIPNNIMPLIIQVANKNIANLCIYGSDYPTFDGTGVRDYIHVMDLAEGHVAALDHLTEGVHIYNLGTGKGTSVLQLIKTFEEVNNIRIPYEIAPRRPGDIATCYADVIKAQMELGWTAKRGIIEMVRDAWRFENKYKSNRSENIKLMSV